MAIDFEALEDAYGDLPVRQAVPKTRNQGSLTNLHVNISERAKGGQARLRTLYRNTRAAKEYRADRED